MQNSKNKKAVKKFILFVIDILFIFKLNRHIFMKLKCYVCSTGIKVW